MTHKPVYLHMMYSGLMWANTSEHTNRWLLLLAFIVTMSHSFNDLRVLCEGR